MGHFDSELFGVAAHPCCADLLELTGRSVAHFVGTPRQIQESCSVPGFIRALIYFLYISPTFRPLRHLTSKHFRNTLDLRTSGIFYTQFERPDPTFDPAFTPNLLT